MEEPLVGVTAPRPWASARLMTASVAAGAGLALLVTHWQEPKSAQADCSAKAHAAQRDVLDHRHLDFDAIRLALKSFVGSLDGEHMNQTYYQDASLQSKQWELCTIVQQCLTPRFGSAMGVLYPVSRGLFYDVMALSLSDEGYKRLLVQQLSNLLLGEMQDWSVNCPGHCAEMDEPSGEIPEEYVMLGTGVPRHRVNVSKSTCKELADGGRHVLWDCEEPPRMIHHGNLNTSSGRYFLGNIFQEPIIHARNDHYDFVEVYGSLKKGEPFGFRFSGHHYDLNFKFDNSAINDLPIFIGHNPLIVPQQSPPFQNHDPRHYMQWRNMAGIGQFPDIVAQTLKVSKYLSLKSYVPLTDWVSTPHTGGLTLSNSRTMDDVNHIQLATVSEEKFRNIWKMIDYTLESARGVRSNARELQLFRTEGQLCWTSTVYRNELPTFHLPNSTYELLHTRSFIYLHIETKELLYFALLNTLFTLVVENNPSNHIHTLLANKSQLTTWVNAPWLKNAPWKKSGR